MSADILGTSKKKESGRQTAFIVSCQLSCFKRTFQNEKGTSVFRNCSWDYVCTLRSSPCYNRTSWLGVTHQLTYVTKCSFEFFMLCLLCCYTLILLFAHFVLILLLTSPLLHSLAAFFCMTCKCFGWNEFQLVTFELYIRYKKNLRMITT